MSRHALIRGQWRSDELPHEKCKINKGKHGRSSTYYFAKTPLGDYAIHEDDGSQMGYDSDYIDFLMTDGSIEKVRGPFHRDGCYGHGEKELIAKHLNRPEIAVEATKLRVGRGVWLLGENPTIIYEEKDFVLGDFRLRLKQEWREKGIGAEIITVCGSRFSSVRDLIPGD